MIQKLSPMAVRMCFQLDRWIFSLKHHSQGRPDHVHRASDALGAER